MGCGVSKVAPLQEEREKSRHINGKPNNHETKTNGHVGGSDNTKSNGHIESEVKPSGREVSSLNGYVYPKEDEEATKTVSQKCSERQPEAISNHSSSPRETSITLSPSKAVAFDIVLGQKDLERLPSAPRPPRRLKKIESAPTLTREALQHKQAAAEQNRQKELEKKTKVMSKRRSELILAREMDKAQQQKAELEKKLAASEKKREKAKADVVAKQKRREEKARRVREMAMQIKEGGDVVNIAVDHDETYNADEEDESWDVNNPVTRSSSSDLVNNNNTENRQQSSQAGTNHPNSIEQEANTAHDFFDS